ncbi:MAG: RNA polymerase sigma factor [Prevotellaceae bacterium]|jgi:RNA polymerase sigma-70 factor (ECF subfamily)|nr:RNA polymerase sigma factor [Prevotellaceae bacterium]
MVTKDSNITIQQSIKGDRKAQMQLYETFYRKMYNSCLRILRNRYDAEDAMQESFIKAFTNLGKYDSKISFEAWIMRIAINTAIDKLRKDKMEFIIYNEAVLSNKIDSQDEDEDERELITQKAEQIKAAIEQLPDMTRLIVTLYLIEGYDQEEIAGILKIQPGNVRIQYMRAKQKLIEIIKQNKK